MKTLEQLRTEAAEAAKADLLALDPLSVDCKCGTCMELLAAQFRWNYERLERAAIMSTAGTMQIAPDHVHTLTVDSEPLRCSTCGLLLIKS